MIRKFILFIFAFGVLFSCQNKNETVTGNSAGQEKQTLNSASMTTDTNGLSKTTALLKTVHGNVLIKFYPKEAPNTVTRIVELIQRGFYDGINFHRVVPKFVAQAGDPTGVGTGGSGSKLKAEFNRIQHIKGTVAMARAQEDKDSADSQFYFALNTLPHLDGNYTVFAQVIEGLDVLDKIQQGDKILSFSIKD